MYKFLKVLCFSLVIIGALNWGLIGAFQLDLVSFLFGEMSKFTRFIYLLVGISGFLLMVTVPFCDCFKSSDK